MCKIIIANCNPILNDIQERLVNQYDAAIIKEKEDLNQDTLALMQPDYIFFLHWSWIIPKEIFSKYTCIVFHMTDLPYGRGGSPLQNLILRGHKKTKLSALKVDKGIDTGDIYLKKDLSLEGKASEIFKAVGEKIKIMIEEIISNKIEPTPQTGIPVNFVRRKPEQSIISDEIDDVEKLYDFIRMLDAENYPNAFLENKVFKLAFTNAKIVGDNELIANVRITKK